MRNIASPKRETVPLQTEFEFNLPEGYVDEHGTLHRNGAMRLATAADEIIPLNDPRVQRSPSYRAVIILSHVVTQIDGSKITMQTIERLSSTDLAYLKQMYNRINRFDPTHHL